MTSCQFEVMMKTMFRRARLVLSVLICGNSLAGTWTYVPWTGDADSGITSALDYSVAVNTSGDAVTVNGVTFQADAASGTNFSITGAPDTSSSCANITGNSRSLANAFICSGNPLTVTLSNLTSGAAYETSFFSYGFDAAGMTRIQTFETGSDNVAVDQNHYGQGNGIRITYSFVATASSKVFTITPSSDNTFHLSALANRKVTPATILSFGSNISGSTAVLGKPSRGTATIAWTVPYSMNLAMLAPTYTVNTGTGMPASGNLPSPNFSAGSVTYKIRDGVVTTIYTVTAAKAPPNTACDLLAFNPNLAGSRVTVMSTDAKTGTVVVSVPAGTTNPQLAAITPTLTLSPYASCVRPATPLSLTGPVHYVVKAEDGVTTRDYTATVMTNAGAYRLFVVKTKNRWLAGADYDYLSLIPVSKHVNKGVPAILAVASTNDFTSNIYLQDYLRRYRPAHINTINCAATISNFTCTAINSSGPLELSVYMATNCWVSAGRVVLISDVISKENYPNVLQASALASALDAPLIYYNSESSKKTLVQNAIRQLGATEVIYVNAAGTKPALATRVLKSPVDIVKYLDENGIKVDYFAATNPKDLSLVSGAKLSLTAPFIAARRGGVVVPITTYEPVPNSVELFHYTGYPAIKAELQLLYDALGRYPSYLALVGNATSIPLSYREPNEQAGQCIGSPSDLDYSNVDGDEFPDIAIGRIMAYNIFDASLYTSRISTYEELFDGVWEKTMVDVGGQWNAAYQAALGANYGFVSTNLIGSLGLTQPLETAIIAHNDHSSYHDLGGAFSVGSVNVLAPAFVGSDGCAAAAIDFETINESYDEATGWKNSDRGSGILVVNQLFRLGAVAFMGSTRVEPGPGKMRGSAAVNALLSGEPLGRCYMAGVDTMTWNGADDQRWNWIFLGDPGLKIHVPSAPIVPPASHSVTPASSNTAILTVNIPTKLFASEVDPTWCSHWGLKPPQYWGDKPGLYGMDVDRFYMVRFTPPRAVLSVEELGVWTNVNTWVWGDVKLGMMGAPSLDYQQDGTTQLVWAIRANIMDWAGSKDKVPLATMTNATFRIRYSSGVTTNSSSFRCAPWTGDADSGITSTSVNSGWMPCTVWTNTCLTPSVTYGDRVKARDALSNATHWSAVATAKPLDLVLNVAQSVITSFVLSWPATSGFRSRCGRIS